MKTESTFGSCSPTLSIIMLLTICAFSAKHPPSAYGVPANIEFVQSASIVDAYDFVEVTLRVGKPDAGNPFTDVVVEGWFARNGGRRVRADGFCDSADGKTFRIRFMPTQPGSYDYCVTYRCGSYEKKHTGQFTARTGKRRGLVRVDKYHPCHFLWEGTGEHYFWNATTTYWLLGWDDETIRINIDRLHKLKVNRLRTAIYGRVKNGRAWFENVFPTDKFSFLLNPWVAQRPDSVEKPGFDVKRFNIPRWQKIERMLHHARDKDMIISIIFYVDGARPGVDPFGKRRMGQVDESMIMLKGYAYILDFFTSIPWWELEPNNDFFEAPRTTSVRQEVMHVVYTRDKTGKAKILLDGRKQAETAVTTETSSWDTGYRFALANELTRDRPWLGEFHQVAVYDRALSEQEAIGKFRGGTGTRPEGALVFYDFQEGSGQIIKDRSNRSDLLDLRIENSSALQWLSNGGLAVRSPVLIASKGAAAKISNAVRESNAITIEVWIKPANTTQSGPARIVTVSCDPGSRNFTLGQKAGAYEVRFRTTSTSANGEPALSSPGGDDAIPRICGLRSPEADLAVLYFTAGGQARIKPGSLAKRLRAQWYNTRNGKWADADKPAQAFSSCRIQRNGCCYFRNRKNPNRQM